MKTAVGSKFSVLTMAQIAVCTALLCVSAWVSIPLPIGVPFTLQLLMVILVALLLKPVYALVAQVLYTLLGIVGLPVFSGFKGGIGAIFSSPTGGYIIGFIIAAFLISLLKGKNGNIIRYLVVAVFVGIPAIYIPGLIGYMLFTGADLFSAFIALVPAFIVFDVVKCVLAAFASLLVKKALLKANIGFEN